MDKKVWAIVGIIALHLALMLVFRGTLKPEELVQSTNISHPDAVPILPNPYLVPKVPSDGRPPNESATPAETVVAPATKKTPRSETVSRPRRERHDPGTKSVKAFESVAVEAAAVTPPVFKDTIILVKATEIRPIYLADKKTTAEPRASAPAARITPIKKKKPFFKRAVLPVIRKPYDLIKTLVSKL